MSHSIRRRLLVIFLALFIITWMSVTIAVYNEARHETEELFDAQLSQLAGLLGELADSFTDTTPDINTMQRSVYGHKYERHVAFQIWKNDNLVIRTKNASTARYSDTPGFSDIHVDDKKWRIFMHLAEDGRHVIYTAESYKARDELISSIVRDALLPLPLAIPVMLLMVWLAIGNGLGPLTRIANEVRQRRPDRLTPLEIDDTPDEILPLTGAINRLLRKLSESLEKEKRFTADAAHELRTPLAGIRAQSQVALRSSNKDQRNHALHNIIEAVDHSSHLVEQMLVLAQLDPDKYSSDFSSIELGEVLNGFVQSQLKCLENKDVKISLDFDTAGERPCNIKADPTLVGILLRNLVDNAVRYIGEGDQITISLKPATDRAVVLSVSDNGPGLSENEKQRVLERFYRPAGQKHYGSGLGLSIVSRICDLHHAVLLLTDTLPHGLTVSVKFPCAD